ncbi:MAG: YbgC/FadM family acyl-CoA thioesterase [Candidatus Omnitrophota bacterium]|nr:MAG: YbgC/FadM family acyl-CoA thioesterase [Candidatus Omnitrophota bacterium]
MTKKIYYHDTDCGGVVYYANYLKYFEEARTEFLRTKGLDIKKLSEEGILFVVKKVEIDYKSPARYGDTIEIITELSRLRNVSLEFTQQTTKEGTVLNLAKTILVCIGKDFLPRPLPDAIISLLKA